MDIILIGMAGCGKTTLGKALARRLGMELVDLDAEIESRENKSISCIFADEGEEYFRRCETQALKNAIGKNRIISTGGGIVVKEENIAVLSKADAKVVFIDRPIERITADIDLKSRPLLSGGVSAVAELYKQRYDKYKRACNLHFVNDMELDSAAEELARLINEV